jgi:DtxR family Mn-dependent transcriptional regulator
VASLTVENYLKTIFQLDPTGEGSVSTGKIAEAMGVSPGTVTSMLKTLADGNLAAYRPYEGVSLTPAGRGLALRVIRRHRLIELFLARTLDLTWDEVHEEAEHMEHAVSDRLIDRIDEFLGFPKSDPHGDPIPTAEGAIVERGTVSLAHCDDGQAFRIVRVLEQSPEFLRELADSGIGIGVSGQIHESHDDGSRTLDVGAAPLRLEPRALESICVVVMGG